MKNYKIGRYIDFDDYGNMKIVPVVSKIYSSYEEAKKDAYKIRNMNYVEILRGVIKEVESRIQRLKEGYLCSYSSIDDCRESIYAWDDVVSFDEIEDLNKLEYNSFVIYSDEDEKANKNDLFTYFPNYDEYLLKELIDF